MIDRSTRIYMAYLLAQKKFAKTDPLLSNFKAVLFISNKFGVPFLQVQNLVKSRRK